MASLLQSEDDTSEAGFVLELASCHQNATPYSVLVLPP